jgi:Family of unknown function (DUF6526)
MAQSYAHHAHRPTLSNFASLFSTLALVCFIGAWFAGWNTWEYGAVSGALALMALTAISRIYIVRLQDRIIRLEMKVRCAELLPVADCAQLAELSPKQVVALRFASDAELGPLLARAVAEKLEPKQIKRAITNWRADHMRT